MKETEEETLNRVKDSVCKSICGKLFKDCTDDQKAACVDIVAQRYLSERLTSSLPDKEDILCLYDKMNQDGMLFSEFSKAILKLLTKGDR